MTHAWLDDVMADMVSAGDESPLTLAFARSVASGSSVWWSVARQLLVHRAPLGGAVDNVLAETSDVDSRLQWLARGSRSEAQTREIADALCELRHPGMAPGLPDAFYRDVIWDPTAVYNARLLLDISTASVEVLTGAARVIAAAGKVGMLGALWGVPRQVVRAALPYASFDMDLWTLNQFLLTEQQLREMFDRAACRGGDPSEAETLILALADQVAASPDLVREMSGVLGVSEVVQLTWRCGNSRPPLDGDDPWGADPEAVTAAALGNYHGLRQQIAERFDVSWQQMRQLRVLMSPTIARKARQFAAATPDDESLFEYLMGELNWVPECFDTPTIVNAATKVVRSFAAADRPAPAELARVLLARPDLAVHFDLSVLADIRSPRVSAVLHAEMATRLSTTADWELLMQLVSTFDGSFAQLVAAVRAVLPD